MSLGLRFFLSISGLLCWFYLPWGTLSRIGCFPSQQNHLSLERAFFFFNIFCTSPCHPSHCPALVRCLSLSQLSQPLWLARPGSHAHPGPHGLRVGRHVSPGGKDVRLPPEEVAWVPAGYIHRDLVPFLSSSLSWVALTQLLRSQAR